MPRVAATVKLTPDGPNATQLHYAVDAQIGGKLAQLGARLIDATAKKLAGEFFEAFAAAVGTAESPVGESPIPAAVAPAAPPRQEWIAGFLAAIRRIFGIGAAPSQG